MITIARDAGIDEVYVSTDCAEIADAAAYVNAHVINRPPELATDAASSESVLTHALESLQGRIDILVFLQCTGPLLTVNELRGAIDMYIKSNVDTVFTAVPFHGFIWHKDGKGCNHTNQREPRKRRQDIEPQYLETGEAYIMDAQDYLLHKNRFFGYSIPFITKRKTVEVDDSDDLVIANAILQQRAIDGFSK